jgi:hypothetical protein
MMEFEYKVYDEEQVNCPNCGSPYIDREPGQLVDGGGNYQADCLDCYCSNCEAEWSEPPLDYN